MTDLPGPGYVELLRPSANPIRRTGRALVENRAWNPRCWIEAARDEFRLQRDRRRLMAARGGSDVCWTDQQPDPLVSVRIATTGNRDELFTRALPSVLRQTYERLEVIVVQDGPDPDLSARVAAIGDPRIRYHRLSAGGSYPKRAKHRWLVGGYHPMNVGNDLATGSWIAPCDDDDEFTDDHVAVLLEAAQSRRLEFVHSRTAVALTSQSDWAVIGAPALLRGQVSHGSVLFAASLRFLRYSGSSWRRSQPFDFHLWRRMERLGVRMGFVDRITYRYFPAEFSRANYEREARRALEARRRGLA